MKNLARVPYEESDKMKRTDATNSSYCNNFKRVSRLDSYKRNSQRVRIRKNSKGVEEDKASIGLWFPSFLPAECRMLHSSKIKELLAVLFKLDSTLTVAAEAERLKESISFLFQSPLAIIPHLTDRAELGPFLFPSILVEDCSSRLPPVIFLLPCFLWKIEHVQQPLSVAVIERQ